MRVFVVHYSEIALKGKNRSLFEKKLIENIKRKIDAKIRRESGRIIIEDDNAEISESLKKIPGIKYFALAEVADLDIEEIKEKALSLVSGGTFKIETKRSNKKFPLTSIDINRIVGEYILNKKNIKVNLKNPETTVFIEICDKQCYLYTEKIYGVGGLPCGVSGKVITLLSGKKSALASFLMMKRGAEVVAVNFSKTNDVVSYAKKLSEHHKIKLYIIPKIVSREEMIRIANEIAKKENAKGIVVGDVIPESGDIESLSKLYSLSELPVFTPVICFDKIEYPVEIFEREPVSQTKIIEFNN
uniref:tRNA 4-thiouridine(8) synthase ThiI n=1 Tax=Geoglobus ahangari TaxID=113653 RepID=A0A7C4WJT8_9EURY